MKKNKHKNYKFGVKHQILGNSFKKEADQWNKFFQNEIYPELVAAGCTNDKICLEKTGRTMREFAQDACEEFLKVYRKDIEKKYPELYK